MTLFTFELKLYLRKYSESLNMLVMFLLACMAFAMSQPHGTKLDNNVHGILWTIALLTLTLTHYRIFLTDYEDGTMEQWRHIAITEELIVIAKIITHWLMTALPLVILTPLALTMLAADAAIYWTSTILSLIIGSIGFTAIGAMAASLSLRLRTGDILSNMLIIPFAAPLIIFGTEAARTAFVWDGAWLLLIAFTAISCAISTIAAAAAIRLSSQQWI